MKKWEIIAVVGTFVVVIAVALVTLLPNCQWESPSVSHKLCVNKVKPNLALKRHTGSIDLSRWIGYRADNSCVVPDPAMLDSLGLRVTNFVQYEGPGTCTDMTDTNCPIVANGLTVSVKGTDYAASEVRKFDVTIQDARGDQVHVFLVTQSGQIFRSGDQNSKIIRTLK